MDDRRTSLVAAAFGSIAIGGFWFVRPLKSSTKLLVLDQWTPSVQSGLDGNAARLIRFELKGRTQDEAFPTSFRIVGAGGVAYPLVPADSPGMFDTMKLPRGYRRRIEAPRLVAMSDERILASVPINDLPAPERQILPSPHDCPVSLVLHGPSALFAEPVAPIPENERWQVVVRRTPFAKDLDATAMVAPTNTRGSRRLSVPFAEEADRMEVDWTRFRLRPETEVIRIDGMSLVRRAGATSLVVDRKRRITSRLGADILLPEQDNGPRRPSRRGDPRLAIGNLSITPFWLSRQGPDIPRSRGPKVEILSPSPESLGLRELRVATQSRIALHEPKGPVKTGPFSVTLRVTFFHPIPIETRRIVLPIKIGKPLPFLIPQFGSEPFRFERR